MTSYKDNVYYERPARHTPGTTVDPITFVFRNKLTREPVVPVSVCSHLKDDLGRVVHTFESIIKPDGRVTLHGIPPSITRTFQNGLHTHGVTYTLGGGRVVVYLNIGIVFEGRGLAC